MNRTMRKSRYVTLLLAGAAATALAACDQNVMTGTGADEATLYGDPAACAKDIDAEACNTAYEVAKEEHVKQAPKFATKEECEAAGFQACETTQVQTAQGGTGSMFMPMMMGYMMGRTLGGMGGGLGGGLGQRGTPTTAPGATNTAGAAPATARAARPVYSDRNGYLYANGGAVGRVAPGTTSLGSQGIAMRTTARGGFGASARSFGGGSMGGGS